MENEEAEKKSLGWVPYGPVLGPTNKVRPLSIRVIKSGPYTLHYNFILFNSFFFHETFTY